MSVIKLIATHDCYRCIALQDKYYSHWHYWLCFTHADLQHREDDAWSRNCLDLIDNYTREEIKTKYILNCLHTELLVQSSSNAQNALATSVLEFIWKIGNRSNAYTTEAYQKNCSCIVAFRVSSLISMTLSKLSWIETMRR